MLNENSGITYDDGYHKGYNKGYFDAKKEILDNLEYLCKDIWSLHICVDGCGMDSIEESENCFEFLKSKLMDNLEG